MEIVNLLHYTTREELRRWLEENHDKERCCWVVTHRGKCPEWAAIPYIEVVEEARPGIDGRKGMAATFDGLPDDFPPTKLQLVGVEKMGENIWAKYKL